MKPWVSTMAEAQRLSSYDLDGANPFETLGGRMVVTTRAGNDVMVRPRRGEKTGARQQLHNLLQPVSPALRRVLRTALVERRVEVVVQMVSHPRDLAGDCRTVAGELESVGLRVTNGRLG